MLNAASIRRLGTGSTALNGLVVGLVVVGLTLWLAFALVGGDTPVQRAWRQRLAEAPVATEAQVPAVEPVQYQAMTAEQARTFNETIPFSTRPNPAARPFGFPGGAEDRLRALDCLSAAVLYEAGDDPVGQKAVAQVILNRVRHPAFPHTVCGVVFQGSERTTGCQFTFTCDGALTRSYSQPLWDRARAIADAALSGSVYKPVGQATHYHTDWVVPYWSSSLDKIVAVHTHLFFRWSGWWGTPPAFRFAATGSEPHVPQLAMRFPEHQAGFIPSPLAEGDMPGAMAAIPGALASGGAGGSAGGGAEDAGVFAVKLDLGDAANFAQIAMAKCGARPRCKFLGWTDGSRVPSGAADDLTLEQLATVSFSYLRDRSINMERALWNCTQITRPSRECMWRKLPSPVLKAPPGNAPPASAPVTKLGGVRFKDEQRPATKP